MNLFFLPTATLIALSRIIAGQVSHIELAISALVILYGVAALSFHLAGARGVSVGGLMISVSGAVMVGAAHGFLLFPILLLVARQQFSFEGYGLFATIIAVGLIILQALETAESQRRAPLAREGQGWPL